MKIAWALPRILALALSITNAVAASAQAHWRLADRPSLTIGSVDGPPFLTFHDIRGVVTAEDTLIVIGDGGTRELRIFARSGEFLRAFGRRGEGPREFAAIQWVDMCRGPEIVVYDFARTRITKWNTEGALLEEFTVQSTDIGRPPYSLSCGPAGTFVQVGWPDVAAFAIATGPYRPEAKVGVLDRRGRLTQLLGAFPGPERYRFTSNDGPRPWGRATIARVGREVVYVGTAESYEILVVGPDGSERSFGKPAKLTPLNEEMIEQWQDSIIRRAPPDRRPAFRRALDSHELPAFIPPYSNFYVDLLDYIWVEPYGVPGQRVKEWDVFSADGVLVASVDIPNNFRPTEIGADYVLGVSTNGMGVESARLYSLFR